MHRHRLFLLTGLGLVVAAAAGCPEQPQLREQRPRPTPRRITRTGPLKAVWVTRFDFRTPADIRTIMDDCRDLGLNAVMFQVRGNGTAFYRSSIEPWAIELGGRDPGFDPLDVAVTEAHARGLELHAWANVMPGWRGPKPPSDPRQLYNTHPEWFWYDQTGKRQPLVQGNAGQQTGWYVSLNPCLPEVRSYLVDLFREIVANYDIDGLHIDYIRFPNELSPKGTDYPRDRRTLELYRAATGMAPDDDPWAWTLWRADQVSRIVRDTHAMIERIDPTTKLSAAVGPDPVKAKARYCQDGETWVRNRWVDFLVPMNYTDDDREFAKLADGWRRKSHGVPIVIGIGLFKHDTVEQSIRQLEITEQMHCGFCLFSYAALFGSDRGRAAETLQQRLRSKLLATTNAVSDHSIAHAAQ